MIQHSALILACMHGGTAAFTSRIDGSHVEEQRRYGCEALQVNQTQAVGEVPLSGPDEEQPT